MSIEIRVIGYLQLFIDNNSTFAEISERNECILLTFVEIIKNRI